MSEKTKQLSSLELARQSLALAMLTYERTNTIPCECNSDSGATCAIHSIREWSSNLCIMLDDLISRISVNKDGQVCITKIETGKHE